MRTTRVKMVAGFGLAAGFAGLVIASTGCVSEPNTQTAGTGGTGTGGRTGGAGGSTSGAGGLSNGSGGSQPGGSGGSTSGTQSGGAGGGTNTAPPVDSSSGGPVDAGTDAAATGPDVPAFEVTLVTTEFAPKFDPRTVPGIVPLFDGTSLTGWNCSTDWSVKDNVITAGPGFWGFCETAGTWDKYRLFVSIIQDGTEGDGGHTGIGIDKGTGFHDLMTPGCDWWDYEGGSKGTTTGCPADRAIADTKTKTSPDQVYWHKEWYQMEFLVDVTKGTASVALNSIKYQDHTFTPKNGGKATPIGLQAHNGGSVRYKDIWIEPNPKDPTKLLSVTK